ncbi:epimerase family protein sdr39u1 [Plakobranchus ocellatus]|uniref:Epimerase family protein sdr39u1 n=1 Tax=Plakobranchus ocellatus TaxID=259542 RepID=A0AAV4AWC0_9GAST|nr:epimerase family protein sdr39u1 [Plakobranchus ocellatus]
MSIIVGGGTGFIGRYFAQLGTSKGYKVISVSRKGGPNRITWSDVIRNGLPEDCVAVVSMSGEQILQPFKRWTADMKARVRESRVEKTQLLNRAVCEASKPPKVFVEYTEDDEVIPYDFLSELTKEWEAAAKLPSTVPTRSVIIRTGVVVGRGGGVVENIRLPFTLGLGGPIGSGQQWFPWIHVNDMAGIILHAIEKDSVTGVLNGTAPNPVKSAEFTKSFASALNRPHLFPLPGFVVKTVFGSEEADVLLEGQKVLPKRTQESGYKFKFPDVHSACKEVVS